MKTKMIALMRFDDSVRAQRMRERLEADGLNPVLRIGAADLGVLDGGERVELLVPMEEAAVAADVVDSLEELEEEELEEPLV
jgi:hypothetical protein